MNKLCSLIVVLVAACGSRSAPTTTTPDDEAPPASTPDAGHGDHHAGEPPAPAPDAGAEPSAPDPEQVKAELLAAETAAYEAARPVFDQYCASCHTQGAKGAKKKILGHFDMTSYPFGGHHAHEVAAEVRHVLGLDGSKPTMPKGKPGSVKGDELAVIEAWAAAFQAAHEGGAHEGRADHGHGGGHHR